MPMLSMKADVRSHSENEPRKAENSHVDWMVEALFLAFESQYKFCGAELWSSIQAGNKHSNWFGEKLGMVSGWSYGHIRLGR